MPFYQERCDLLRADVVRERSTREMQLSHEPSKVDAVFDEANLVSCAGLAPVMGLVGGAGGTGGAGFRIT